MRKIRLRRSRSSDYTELGHFTLFFLQPGRQRNVHRRTTHVHSCCFALLFSDVPLPGAVEVFVKSLLFSVVMFAGYKG